MRFSFGRPLAVAHVGGQGQSGPTGILNFYQAEDGILVTADIRRLPYHSESDGRGIFALHIHEGSSCAGPDFADTKGHFNPGGYDHPWHAGDLPPLFSCNGHAFLAVLTNRFRIRDILGRTVVIHSQQDDFTSQPSGNSGSKIACGIIRPI